MICYLSEEVNLKINATNSENELGATYFATLDPSQVDPFSGDWLLEKSEPWQSTKNSQDLSISVR